MRRICILVIVFVLWALIQGCAPGYNSVLFATRSNLGFDADTSPPNLEIGISRTEGVLEPTFEGGQTVPVMGSFSSDSVAFSRFFWGVRSTFSTGKSAAIMSELYNDKTPPKTWNSTYNPVKLSKEPDLPPRLCFIKEGQARPVLFVTDTNLGIKIRWSGQTAQYPSSINIGFKRKELALAPLGLTSAPTDGKVENPAGKQAEGSKPDNPGSTLYVDSPALLATLDVGVTAETGANLKYLQYFATGAAANNLARRREVREAMLQRTDPLQAKLAEKAKKEEEQKETNAQIIDQIVEIFKKASTDNQAAIMNKAKELKLMDETVTAKNFEGKLAKYRVSDTSITNQLNELKTFASGLK